MKALRLYIENFICHEKSFIDFTEFNSALIVGKVANNDLRSNGVGKSTIFKAIEYVLFNESDTSLEEIVRDDTNFCCVTFDFEINDISYRLIRKRTRKGTSDLSLYEIKSDIYHNSDKTPIIDNLYKDLSGRRISDTEKDLEKLIKINYKSFRIFVHFVQNDFSGLTTLTPEKRKTLLKEPLDLIAYSKLEKIAKDEASKLSKEIDKLKILIDNFGKPNESISSYSYDLSNLDKDLNIKQNIISSLELEVIEISNKLNELSNKNSLLESNFSNLLQKQNSLNADKTKTEISVKEYTTKKNNISKIIKELELEIKQLQSYQETLSKIDLSNINDLSQSISQNKDKIVYTNALIKNSKEKLDELSIPFPDDNKCKHCRQILTEEHKKNCLDSIDKDLVFTKNLIKSYQAEIVAISNFITKSSKELEILLNSKQSLENLISKILEKSKDLEDKNSLYSEYSRLLDKFTFDFNDKINELNVVSQQLNQQSISDSNIIKNEILNLFNKKSNTLNVIKKHSNELLLINNNKAILSNNIEKCKEDVIKLNTLQDSLLDLNEKYSAYPDVIQAFSSHGIPNLIIQNVLDDLQIEANKLLDQLRPGLQLSFIVEKEESEDTLEIIYFSNGKKRRYEQLSGAMKLAVTFSLKLGLSFLLQKIMGVDIKFLLLDEIDQSLDKASIDSFADIIRFFQKDFTILVITHNDRLKDKFSSGILVEQDLNFISKAKVVSSW